MPHERELPDDDLQMQTERTRVIPCPNPQCEGGSIDVTIQLPTPSYAMEPRYAERREDCPTCKGEGEVEATVCLVCGGTRAAPDGSDTCSCSEDAMEAWLSDQRWKRTPEVA